MPPAGYANAKVDDTDFVIRRKENTIDFKFWFFDGDGIEAIGPSIGGWIGQ